MLCFQISTRHQRHIGIAFSEKLLNGLGILAQLGIGPINMGGAVIEVVPIGCQKAGNDQYQEHAHQGDHHPRNHFSKPAKTGKKTSVLEMHQPFLASQNHHWHKHEHCDQADGDPFGQSQSQIRTQPELHKDQCEKSDHWSKSAGQDGPCGFAQSFHHRFFGIGIFLNTLFKAVDEKHRIIQ